jgi:uncharacterized protein
MKTILIKYLLIANLIGVLFLCSCSSPFEEIDKSEIKFFESEDIKLSYELDLPGNDGNYPIVVLGHGSGPKTKDALIGFSEKLLAQNIAVFRYDKRGTGNSEGIFIPSNDPAVNSYVTLLAQDMVAAVNFISKRNDLIDTSKIGLFGESQSGWVISTAGAKSLLVKFIIVLSGPTVPLEQVALFESMAQSNPDIEVDTIADNVVTNNAGYNPQPFLDQLDIPGLWIYGAKDRHIPVKNCVKILNELKVKNNDIEIIIYENGDHSLRDFTTKQSIDYWQNIYSWLNQIRIINE